MTDVKKQSDARIALSLAKIKAAAVAKRSTTPKATPSGHWVTAVEMLRSSSSKESSR